jgi:hypothetical protein
VTLDSLAGEEEAARYVWVADSGGDQLCDLAFTPAQALNKFRSSGGRTSAPCAHSESAQTRVGQPSLSRGTHRLGLRAGRSKFVGGAPRVDLREPRTEVQPAPQHLVMEAGAPPFYLDLVQT